MEKLDLYEYTIEDVDIDGMTAISLVDFPAIEENFIILSKQEKQKFEVSKLEKNRITGPALIPNKKIYRNDFLNGEFEVFFSKATIKEIAEDFINKKDNVTIDHSLNANNITMVESWIITDPKNDKSTALGFTNLPEGTWMVTYRVDNPTILDQINNGFLNGFSIEAFITSNLVQEDSYDIALNEIEQVIDNLELTEEEMYNEINSILEMKNTLLQ